MFNSSLSPLLPLLLPKLRPLLLLLVLLSLLRPLLEDSLTLSLRPICMLIRNDMHELHYEADGGTRECNIPPWQHRR